MEMIPEMYLFFYCKFLDDNLYSRNISRERALILLGYHCPHALKQAILKEMEEYGLIKRIDQRKIELQKISRKKIEKFINMLSEVGVKKFTKLAQHNGAL
jgi:hypothetical protein